MNKFNKNVSKIIAIVTGFGLNFGAYNSKAMQEKSVETVKAEEKTEGEIYDEKQKELDKRLAEADRKLRKLRDKICGKEQTEVGRPRPWDKIKSESPMLSKEEKKALIVFGALCGSVSLLFIALGELVKKVNNEYAENEQDNEQDDDRNDIFKKTRWFSRLIS